MNSAVARCAQRLWRDVVISEESAWPRMQPAHTLDSLVQAGSIPGKHPRRPTTPHDQLCSLQDANRACRSMGVYATIPPRV